MSKLTSKCEKNLQKWKTYKRNKIKGKHFFIEDDITARNDLKLNINKIITNWYKNLPFYIGDCGYRIVTFDDLKKLKKKLNV